MVCRIQWVPSALTPRVLVAIFLHRALKVRTRLISGRVLLRTFRTRRQELGRFLWSGMFRDLARRGVRLLRWSLRWITLLSSQNNVCLHEVLGWRETYTLHFSLWFSELCRYMIYMFMRRYYFLSLRQKKRCYCILATDYCQPLPLLSSAFFWQWSCGLSRSLAQGLRLLPRKSLVP